MVATQRVLVVDDEDVVCKSYERVLKNAGYEVEKAHDGRQALASVAARDFDVMLADLRMPGMDGLELVREVKATHPKMPVIVITGYPSQDTLQEAARLGVTDYLTKPVAPDVLTHATEAALSMPTWREVAPHMATATLPAPTTLPRVAEVPVPGDLAAQPAVPPPIPAPAPVVPAAAPALAPARRRPGVIRSLLALAGGLVVSLVYVLFLPLAGFAVLLGLYGKALVRKLATRRA